MAKLYYTSTSCGAASFIAAFSAGVSIQAEQVNLKTHKTVQSGLDFYEINPKGNVPTIVLEDGTVLNENVATLQYIADLNPGAVAPVNGTIDRFKLQNILSYIATEVHPSIGGLFAPNADAVKDFIRGKAAAKLTYLENNLIADKSFLLGDSFTIADSYLYIVLSWTKYVAIDLAPYPNVSAYFNRIGNLPNVKAAHERIATSPSTTY